MQTTTTNSVSLLQPGIVLNTFRTSSGFKTPYLVEQEIEIRSLAGNLHTHLIIDLSKINCPKDRISKLLSHEIVLRSKSTALVTKEKSLILFLNLWKKIKNSPHLNCFTSQEHALNWIKSLD